MDALALTPAAGIFSVPSACAGACGVVEEQVALRASAPPQPVGFEGVEFIDEASGPCRSRRRVDPDQLSPRYAVGHNEFDLRGAAGGERIDLSTVQSPAGENRLGGLGRRPLKSTQLGQVGLGHRLVDRLGQLRGRDGDVGQDRLGVWGGRPGRPPRLAQVGQQQQQLGARRQFNDPQLWRGCDAEAR